MKFSNPTTTDERRVNNYRIIDATIAAMPEREHLAITAIKVDHDFKGFISYKKRPFSWEVPEITVHFESDQEFMDKFVKVNKFETE